MEYKPELTNEACNVNTNHLSEQIKTLSSSLHKKEVAVAQLQSELQTNQQAESFPEKLLMLIERMVQIAELKYQLQVAGYQKQQKELEKEAALQKMKARGDLEIKLHDKLGKL